MSTMQYSLFLGEKTRGRMVHLPWCQQKKYVASADGCVPQLAHESCMLQAHNDLRIHSILHLHNHEQLVSPTHPPWPSSSSSQQSRPPPPLPNLPIQDSGALDKPIADSHEQNCALCPAGIDSSAPALELAESNACLNGWAPGQYTFLKNDIAKYMQQQIAEGNMWDFVVLDPPKLAPNRKSLTRALTKYRNLNSLVCFMTGFPVYSIGCSCTKCSGKRLWHCSKLHGMVLQMCCGCEDLHLLQCNCLCVSGFNYDLLHATKATHGHSIKAVAMAWCTTLS